MKIRVALWQKEDFRYFKRMSGYDTFQTGKPPGPVTRTGGIMALLRSFLVLLHAIVNSLKQLFYIKTVPESDPAQKRLSMRVGERHYSFAITNITGTDLYSLAYYTAGEMTGELLSVLFLNHEELRQSFFDIRISFDHPASVLVPGVLGEKDSGRLLLDTLYGRQVQSAIITEGIADKQLWNVYAVPNDIRESLGRLFPSAHTRHSYSLGLRTAPDGSGDRIIVDVGPESFSFVALRGEKLLIAQTLGYTSPEDILYYLLKTCNEFSLSREEVRLVVSGLIEKESQLFRELYLYFLHTEFRDADWLLPAADGETYPRHFFTSLNDLARCVL